MELLARVGALRSRCEEDSEEAAAAAAAALTFQLRAPNMRAKHRAGPPP